MLTAKEIKYYASLQDKKTRNTEKKFIVEGLKSVEDGLNSFLKCEIILISFLFSEKNENFIKELKKKKVKYAIINEPDIKKLSDTVTPQGIIGIFNFPREIKLRTNDNFILFLDNISDPGNLGTIIRTCDWFGVKQILLSKNCVDVYNSKVIRSTMGSIFNIEVIKDFSLEEDINLFKKNNYNILCGDLTGKNLFEYQSNNKILLILGRESHGISPEIKNLSDELITIPKKGKAESLNVASAAAVFISYFAG